MPPPRNPLRVAHLIECDGPGGAERVVAALAASLQQTGAENTVFVPARGEGWLERELRGSGVAIEHFHLEKPLSPACARWIADAFRRRRIAVAHSHEFTMAVYGAWASWYAGVPHLITMHGSRYYNGRLRRRLAMRAAVAASGGLVAVSHRLADQLSGDLGARRAEIAVVINGVRCDGAADSTLRGELSIPPADPLVVAIGNLYPVKGHAHLIDAVALLAGRHPTLHVAIAGRGDLEGELMKRAQTCGIASRVHLLGLRDDVANVLAAADVFALPSLSEGLPLALLEAMFSGRPIVASAVGEVPATLDHGRAGVLVPPADPAALADALGLILGDRDSARALGDVARRRAAGHYDVSQMVRRYRTMYDQLLNAPQPAAAPAPGSVRQSL
jgi:glycosyltransferase involved in cell wall biosynthesis